MIFTPRVSRLHLHLNYFLKAASHQASHPFEHTTTTGYTYIARHVSHYRPCSSNAQHLVEKPFEEPTSRAFTCWSCHAELAPNSVVCQNVECRHLQPLHSSLNYFDVLANGQVSFLLDMKVLRKTFYKLQQQVHPDMVSQLSEEDRTYSAQQSSFINKGYKTLKDPLSRSLYLLQLYGEDIEDTENSSDAAPDSLKADPDLLVAVLELREKVDEAQTAADVREVLDDVRERMEEEVIELGRVWTELLGAHKVDANTNEREDNLRRLLERAKEVTIRLKYWYGIDEACIQSPLYRQESESIGGDVGNSVEKPDIVVSSKN